MGEPGFVEANGGRIYFEVEGDGHPEQPERFTELVLDFLAEIDH